MAERWCRSRLARAWEGWQKGMHAAAWGRQANEGASLFRRGRTLASVWARWVTRAAARARLLRALEEAGVQIRAERLAHAYDGWRQHVQQRSVIIVWSCASYFFPATQAAP